MHREDPVSPTHQMYLKALYRLCQSHPVGRVRDLAEELGVTPGTVSTALNRLQEMGLIEREHYGGDACLMEHAVSPVTINRITRFLEHLEAGHAVSLRGLAHLYEEGAVVCSDCEAEGYCKAADSAVEVRE